MNHDIQNALETIGAALNLNLRIARIRAKCAYQVLDGLRRPDGMVVLVDATKIVPSLCEHLRAVIYCTDLAHDSALLLADLVVQAAADCSSEGERA